MSDYSVEILLKMRQEGLEQAALVNAALETLVTESKTTNAELDVMRQHTRDTRTELQSMRGDIDRLNSTSTDSEHHLSRMRNELENVSRYTRAASIEMANLGLRLDRDVNPAFDRTTKSAGSGGAASGLWAFIQGAIPGQRTAGNITIAVLAAAAAFAPFTAELAASLVLLGAWAVGGAAFLGVIALAVGGIGLLVAGVAALGLAQMGGIDPAKGLEQAQTKLTTAINQTEAAQEAVRLAQLRYDAKPTAVNLQILRDAQEQLTETQKKQVNAQNAVNTATANANGPVGVLHQSIENMGTALGQKAIPMVNAMASALIPLVPQIQGAGEALMNWFGPRLPAVLLIAQQAFGNVLAAIERLASGWGQLIDHVLARSPEFGNILNAAFNRLIDAALGLLDNLVKLSDWFVARLPVLGANANATFANLGLVVQALGSGLGAFVDWIISHWPQINAMFNASWDAFKQGWGAVQPILAAFSGNLKTLQPLFQYIEQHADNLKVIYWALGAAVALVVAVLEGLFVILVLVTGGIVALGDAIHGSLDALRAGADNVGKWWDGAKDSVGKAIDAIVGHHARVGQTASDAAGKVESATGDMQGDWRKTGQKAGEAATDAGGAAGKVAGDWKTAAGPGDGSVDDSTKKINEAVAGVRGPSATTAQQTHTNTGNMMTDYGNLSQGAETAGASLRGTNQKNQQSNQQTATGFTAALDWITTNVKKSDHENTIAWDSFHQKLDQSMGDNISSIQKFEQEHLKTAGSHERLNTREGEMFKWLAKTIGQTMSDNGSAVNTFATKNAQHTNDIQNANSAQGVNWRELGRVIGKSMDENGQFLSNFGTQVKRLSDFTDYVVFKVMGPAFSALGSAVRDMGGAVGGAFSALGTNVDRGLHAVGEAFSRFGTAVNTALGVFGVPKISPVHYAEGGVVPGYAPGQDTVMAMLSPGEGVLTPQTVRGLGGPSAVEALNTNQGLSAPTSSPVTALAEDMGALSAAIGSIGGQCVVFLQNLLGLSYHGNANTWVNAPYRHTQVGAPGELAVFTGGWYGHLAMVTKMLSDSVFEVLDSNWVAPETIGRHVMDKSMYGFATFLDVGAAGGPGGLAGIPGITIPIDRLNGLMDAALGGLGGWERSFAKGLMNLAAGGVKHWLGFDSGGDLPPGLSAAWNGTGRTETVTPAGTMDEVVDVLRSIDNRLAQLAGQPRLSGATAARRF